MQRRDFLRVAGATGAAMTLGAATEARELPRDKDTIGAREYLCSLMPSREQVENFIRGVQGPERLSRNQGWTFDAELGWVLCDSVRPRSVDGSQGFYSYRADGARKVINFADRPSRIHTYGNSFTHCDQVSDPETWQEYLAGHLQEPIRNYGIGGYGVYQAFRRMLKVEKEDPAEYVILNIYDDDHFRNLDSWRTIRFGGRTAGGFTLPHLVVNVQRKQCKQKENLLGKREDVYRLCDEDFVWRAFKDDAALHVALGTRGDEKTAQKLVKRISETFGIFDEEILALRPKEAIRKIHTEAALYATKNIVTWAEQFVAGAGKKLMLILSFGRGNMFKALQGEAPFDRSFTEWLEDKPYPVIDMRDFFRADYKQFDVDINTYLRRYYIGHHNPAGNFFTAWTIKKRLLAWLDPPPLPYR